MTELVKGTQVFELGRIPFFVSNCDPLFEYRLIALVPASLVKHSDESVWEMKTGCTRDVNDIFSGIANLHRNTLSIQGNCLISRAGRSILLSDADGQSSNVISMVLACSLGWRMLSQQFVLIDMENQTIVPFAAPLSFEIPARQLLQDVPNVPSDMVSVDWSPKRTTFWTPALNITKSERNIPFDNVVFLADTVATEPDAVTENVTSGQMLRKLLSTSNTLTLPKGGDLLVMALPDTGCVTIRGNLEQRVTAALNLISSFGS